MNSQKGITIVSLVVTIIVLIILASISIGTLIGENGIISKAEETKQLQEMVEIKSEIKIEILAKERKNMNNITQKEIEEILMKYGKINKNEDGTIKSLTPTGKEYEIPFEEIYSGTLPLVALDAPEKSEDVAFTRSYGVIEIEFLEGKSYKTSTTPNEPNMRNNMKKVYWEEYETEEGTIEVKEVLEGDEGFDETKWYKYEAQTENTEEKGTSRWANAVTVDDEGNITGYFVWIPRYAYRIIYFDTQEHEDAYRLTGAIDGIVGYSDARGLVDEEGKTPADMEEPVTSIAVGKNRLRPHPAFEDGSKTSYTQGEWSELLEGIWIAKYETSGTSSALKSVPGEKSIIGPTIGTLYSYALSYDEENKSHMLKNSEWGAMAYLTESKYGRNGTEVSPNTDSEYYTAGANGATVASNPLQSTTGNYYGIYDIVGGTKEYVSAYISTGSKNTGNSFASIDDTYNNKTESTQYAMVYNMVNNEATSEENYTANINKKFGDGIIETSTSGEAWQSWGLKAAYFNNNKYPFLARGGTHDTTSFGSGLFSFYNERGNINWVAPSTFRICLI